jgi:hypothetical protein
VSVSGSSSETLSHPINIKNEVTSVYSENKKEPLYRLCGQNAELLNVEAGGSTSTITAMPYRVNKSKRHSRRN